MTPAAPDLRDMGTAAGTVASAAGRADPRTEFIAAAERARQACRDAQAAIAAALRELGQTP